MSTETGAGATTGAAFVVDPARVFEDFVTVAVTELMRGLPGWTKAQHGCRLDEPQPGLDPLSMRPDVVHVVAGEPAVVIDAKYKVGSVRGASSNSDYYQLLAYCTALRLTEGWLAYAGPGIPNRRQIVNTDIAVSVWPLDVSQAPERVLASVAALVVAAWGGRQNGPIPA